MTRPETARRSLEHWSEAGRAEMEAFYALATEDYRYLAAARDWGADLRVRSAASEDATSFQYPRSPHWRSSMI